MLGLGETLDLRRGLLRAVISLRSLEDYYRPIVFSVAGQTTPCDALHASWLLPFPLSRPLRRSVAQLGALWLRAARMGVDAAALDAAEASADPRAALVELVLVEHALLAGP